jgi:hypothetical protein
MFQVNVLPDTVGATLPGIVPEYVKLAGSVTVKIPEEFVHAFVLLTYTYIGLSNPCLQLPAFAYTARSTGAVVLQENAKLLVYVVPETTVCDTVPDEGHDGLIAPGKAPRDIV